MNTSSRFHVYSGLLVIIVFLSWTIFHGNAATIQSDVSALLAFKNAMGNPSSLKSWDGHSDPCDNGWFGIYCNRSKNANARVISMTLPNATLSGQLPGELGDLTAMTSLDLSLNKMLTGPIPTSFGNLVNLESLVLKGCNLTGNLPFELSQLEQLIFLDLSDNNFEGTIPAAWSTLVHMNFFDITRNRIGGPVPVSPGINNWPLVAHLHMSFNLLENIPSELGTLQNLVHLLMDNNNVSGTIPPELGNCSSLLILQLSNNTLTGGIPKELAGLHTLTQLLLSNCTLKGEVPSLATLTSLTALDLSMNLFSGPIPPAIGTELLQLVSINLGYNNFTGVLPTSLGNLTAFQLLNAVNNHLEGSVPLFTWPADYLPEVSLANNMLIGPIPPPILIIQPAIVSMPGNPYCFRPLTLPQQVACNLPLSAPPLPWSPAPALCPKFECGRKGVPNPYLFNTSKSCKCSKPISVTLVFSNPPFYKFNRKMSIILREHFFEALKPTVSSTEQVWITNSTRFGAVQVIYMQIFTNSTAKWSDEDNKAIYDELTGQKNLHLKDFGPFSVRGIDSLSYAVYGLSAAAIAGIVVASILVTIVMAGLLFLLWQRKWGHSSYRWWTQGIEVKGLIHPHSLDELRRATQDFKVKIGEGSYGKVFKGNLNSCDIAVKIASTSNQKGGDSLKTEIMLLSMAKHRNLVNLLGFCRKNSKEILLVYEYIPNGNLYDRLHGNKLLSWKQRMKIAKGCAHALNYLHTGISSPIVHGDIKSSNILLDVNLEPKLADFGSSKLASDRDMVKDVTGTVGYMDPEFFKEFRITPKNDVYSFGVVLLELITGRHPASGAQHLKVSVKEEMLRGGLKNVMDPKLVGYSENDALDVAFLALKCVHENPTIRPTMSQVCSSLEVIGRQDSSPSSPSSTVTGSDWSPGHILLDNRLSSSSMT